MNMGNTVIFYQNCHRKMNIINNEDDKGERMDILVAFIFIIGTLFTATYFIRVVREDKFSIRFGIIGAIISAGYLYWSIFLIMNKLSEIEGIDKYSIILTYLISHLLMFAVVFFVIFYLIIIPYQIYRFTQDDWVKKNVARIKKVVITIIAKHSKLSIVLAKLNIYINPFRKMDKELNISGAKIIKSIILISYLISGIIILTYLTNYLEAEGGNLELSSFKRDYELYKTVFVTSLIPFTINYLKELNK